MGAQTEAFPPDKTRWRVIPEEEAYLGIVRAHEKLAAEYAAFFKEHGLSAPQYNVLRVLYVRGVECMPILEISKRLVNRVPDITRLIDRLESAGLVERRRCTRDRRVIWVHLTDEGLRRVEEIHGPLIEISRRQFAHMTHAELAELTRLLNRARGAE